MTPKQLVDRLGTENGRSAGQVRTMVASKGRASGRMIVATRKKKVVDVTEDDDGEMKRVASDGPRHLAARPEGDVSGTTWRTSLIELGSRSHQMTAAPALHKSAGSF